MLKRALLCVLCLLFSSPFLMAENKLEEEGGDYQYFQLAPDIITNYIKPGKRIGFVRVTVELMVTSKSNYALIEGHEPLIRDRIIRILGEQSEVMIKSSADRETIRQRCLDEVNEVMFAETGEYPLIDLFFTKYLYQ